MLYMLLEDTHPLKAFSQLDGFETQQAANHHSTI